MLAIVLHQSAVMLAVPPLSRAGSLPQGFGPDTTFASTRKNCGSEPARDSAGSVGIGAEGQVAVASARQRNGNFLLQLAL
ncbi:hypothetical protein DZG01_11760 [Pseudomonas fluorescens]|nr:hypothetical protein DZG01_11760 [Pseudomonas fluorescens]